VPNPQTVSFARLQKARDTVVAGLAVDELPVVVVRIERLEGAAVAGRSFPEIHIEHGFPCLGMDLRRFGHDAVQVQENAVKVFNVHQDASFRLNAVQV
jgi:hypothetical protein